MVAGSRIFRNNLKKGDSVNPDTQSLFVREEPQTPQKLSQQPPARSNRGLNQSALPTGLSLNPSDLANNPVSSQISAEIVRQTDIDPNTALTRPIK